MGPAVFIIPNSYGKLDPLAEYYLYTINKIVAIDEDNSLDEIEEVVDDVFSSGYLWD